MASQTEFHHPGAGFWSLHFEDQEIPWQPFSPGVDVYPLCVSPEHHLKAALMRNAPGAKVPEHVHEGYEYILVLSGSETDARATYRAGDFIANAPGSTHEVTTATGNVVLIIWEQPVRFT